MQHNLTPQSNTFQIAAQVVAGTDGAVVTTPTEIDTRGYQSCRIIIPVGVIAAGGLFTATVKNSATSATYGAGTIDNVATLTTTADADASKPMIFEIHRPKRRYLRLQYQRTVANVTLGAIIVELFNPVSAPATQTATWYSVVNDPTPSAT